MQKKINLVLWVVVLIAVITAAFTIYNKNKSLIGVEPSAGNAAIQSTQKDGTGGEAASAALKDPTKAPGFTLKDVDGKTVKLSDYAGKIVFLNFWATWCPYCIEEMPDLDQAGKEFAKGSGAVILTIDVQEKEPEVKKFISDKKISLPVLMDKDGAVAEAYGIQGLPTTVIITPEGNISEKIVGATDKDTILKKADEFIKRIGK